jgi:hypothetical protein
MRGLSDSLKRLSEHYPSADATLFPPAVLGVGMDQFIVENEEQLSPVVVVMTGVLVTAFVIGIAYSAAGFLL